MLVVLLDLSPASLLLQEGYFTENLTNKTSKNLLAEHHDSLSTSEIY
ncbi:MAG: hypothetical protein ACTS73_02065 [Arsenophonus sp. NEOnobi-MAG3]